MKKKREARPEIIGNSCGESRVSRPFLLSEIEMGDIIVDTRETVPLFDCPPCTSATLKTGDYSLRGFENLIAIERKGIGDLFSSIGQGRDRFLRQVRRCSKVEGCVLIEGSVRAILGHKPYGKMTGKNAMATLMSWSVAYSIPVFFADGQLEAQGMAILWMKFARRKICEGSRYRHSGSVCSCGGGVSTGHGKTCKWSQ
jgi:ERCC4-type nuclease